MDSFLIKKVQTKIGLPLILAFLNVKISATRQIFGIAPVPHKSEDDKLFASHTPVEWLSYYKDEYVNAREVVSSINVVDYAISKGKSLNVDFVNGKLTVAEVSLDIVEGTPLITEDKVKELEEKLEADVIVSTPETLLAAKVLCVNYKKTTSFVPVNRKPSAVSVPINRKFGGSQLVLATQMNESPVFQMGDHMRGPSLAHEVIVKTRDLVDSPGMLALKSSLFSLDAMMLVPKLRPFLGKAELGSVAYAHMILADMRALRGADDREVSIAGLSCYLPFNVNRDVAKMSCLFTDLYNIMRALNFPKTIGIIAKKRTPYLTLFEEYWQDFKVEEVQVSGFAGSGWQIFEGKFRRNLLSKFTINPRISDETVILNFDLVPTDSIDRHALNASVFYRPRMVQMGPVVSDTDFARAIPSCRVHNLQCYYFPEKVEPLGDFKDYLMASIRCNVMRSFSTKYLTRPRDVVKRLVPNLLVLKAAFTRVVKIVVCTPLPDVASDDPFASFHANFPDRMKRAQEAEDLCRKNREQEFQTSANFSESATDDGGEPDDDFDNGDEEFNKKFGRDEPPISSHDRGPKQPQCAPKPREMPQRVVADSDDFS